MSYISSINFKKSTSFQVFHNANIRPSYAIGGEIECTLKGYEAEALKNELIAEAKKAYEANRKKKAPKFKAKSFEWSAVVNIKPDSTMQDLERLARFLEDNYKFQCYQIAIHRDEGHINEQGEKVINHHAHLEFITLDKETGKNVYNRANITPAKLRQMQTEVAEILGMERGVDKRLSGAKRVEPRLYAKIKEDDRKQQEALKLEIAQNKKEIESNNKLLEEYDELLEKEKQKTKDLTAEIESLQETKSNSFTSYQEKIAFNIYSKRLNYDLKKLYVDSRDEKVIFKKSGINVEDRGNKLTAKGTDTKEQVKLMLEIAQAKKWNLALLEVSGDDEFKQEAQRQINEILLKKQKEKEEQELKTKKELSNLRLELEKEQQKNKDLTASNNELKKESNDLKSKLTNEIESFKGKNEALKTQVKDLKSANELLEKNKNAQNTQITTLQNDLKQEKEKSKKALAELEKLRKESKNKGLPKEYFQGINQLKKLLKEGNSIEFDKNYESFQNQWKDYNEVTKEIFEDLIYFKNLNKDLDDLILDLDEEIESLQQKNKDLTAENNELKEKIATKENDEKNRNAEVENLRLELEKEQQKIKDLIAENNELKSESNENHLTNINSQLAKVKAMKEQNDFSTKKIELNEFEKAFISDIENYPMSKRFTFKKPAKELEQDEIIALATLWFMPLEQNNRNYIKEILLEAKANNPVFNTIENPHRALTLIATNNNNNMTLGNESTRVLFKFLTNKQPQNERDLEIITCIMNNKKAIERVKNGMHPYQNTTINQNKIKIIEVLDYIIKNKSITKTIARQR